MKRRVLNRDALAVLLPLCVFWFFIAWGVAWIA